MTNIELYINNTLCDIQNPQNLGVRLNRLIINPAELATKDAQYSYSITIPSTPVNDAIFAYANVEEVKNKFNHNHTAQLYVDGITIFEGRFKLSEIDSDGNYKGNLVVPAPKTIKEIFGDKKMNEAGEWWLKMEDPVTTMNNCNRTQDTAPCIFSLVLYGLLPKMPIETVDKIASYSPKTVWDEYVKLQLNNFPPSINCLQAVKEIFRLANYNITGSAYNDQRLCNLYMSYQNPVDKQQDWGMLRRFSVAGKWTNYNKATNEFEKVYSVMSFPRYGTYHAVNLLSSTMTQITRQDDKGANIHSFDMTTAQGLKYKRHHLQIQQSGLYKISFKSSLKINKPKSGEPDCYIDAQTTVVQKGEYEIYFDTQAFEVKVVRSRENNPYSLEEVKFDKVYYKNNQPYPSLADNDNKWTANAELYFPIPGYQSVMLVDPKQNKDLIAGFSWGETPIDQSLLAYNNNFMLENEWGLKKTYLGTILSIKNGSSWDADAKGDNIISAIGTLNNKRQQAYRKVKIVKIDELNKPAEDEDTLRYSIDLNYGEGFANDVRAEDENGKYSPYQGSGQLKQVTWLDAGDILSVVALSGDAAQARGWVYQDIEFELEVEPFKKNDDWVKVDETGTGIGTMNWNDAPDYKQDEINLIDFLPSDVKIDEWMDNFGKAFNLQLVQVNDKHFELNVKQKPNSISSTTFVDLDAKTSIAQASNQPLGLPSVFELGFKINEDEQGFVESKERNSLNIAETGGGRYETGNIDGQVVNQTSSFSYNWYKEIFVPTTGAWANDLTSIQVPVISHNEIWASATGDYAKMQGKSYSNYAQRFWFKTNKGWNVGDVFRNKQDLFIAQLNNQWDTDKKLILNYKNESNTIFDSYFRLIATDNSNYSYVDCYLTPHQYEQLDGSKLVKLNSDLYYIAAIEGYDPLGNNKTRLKLIRKV